LWAERDQSEEDVVFNVRAGEVCFLTTDDADLKTDLNTDLDLECAGATAGQDGGVCVLSWADRADAQVWDDGDARAAQGWEGCGGAELYGVSWWESGFAAQG
jgi:hypothetical protein